MALYKLKITVSAGGEQCIVVADGEQQPWKLVQVPERLRGSRHMPTLITVPWLSHTVMVVQADTVWCLSGATGGSGGQLKLTSANTYASSNAASAGAGAGGKVAAAAAAAAAVAAASVSLAHVAATDVVMGQVVEASVEGNAAVLLVTAEGKLLRASVSPRTLVLRLAHAGNLVAASHLAVLPSGALFVAGDGGDGVIATRDGDGGGGGNGGGSRRRAYSASAEGRQNWGPLNHMCIVAPASSSSSSSSASVSSISASTAGNSDDGGDGSIVYVCKKRHPPSYRHDSSL